MGTINIYEAKTHLSKLLERVEQGEEIVIARAGRPVAKLVPVTKSKEPRKPGAWRGRIWMAPDFEELPEEVLRAFEGEDPEDPLNKWPTP
jgi:prevent-host-death family protein